MNRIKLKLVFVCVASVGLLAAILIASFSKHEFVQRYQVPVADHSNEHATGSSSPSEKTIQDDPRSSINRDSQPKLETKEDIINIITNTPNEYFTYRNFEHKFDDNDIYLILQLLNDESHRDIWPRLIPLITWFADPNVARAKILNFIDRRDEWTTGNNFEDFHSSAINAKVNAFLYLGSLEGRKVDQVLRNSITEKGAKSYVERWLGDKLPGEYDNRAALISDVRSKSLLGLVHSRKENNIQLVKKEYERILELARSSGDYMQDRREFFRKWKEQGQLQYYYGLCDALTINEVIKEYNSIDEYKQASPQEIFQKALRYEYNVLD